MLEQVASGVCFCGSSSDDMLVSFMLAYPNMPIIDELNVKVEGNAEIRRQHKQKIANSERQKTFTFKGCKHEVRKRRRLEKSMETVERGMGWTQNTRS